MGFISSVQQSAAETTYKNAKKYLISGIKAVPEEQDSEVVYYIGQEIAKTNTDLQTYEKNIESVTKEEIINFAKQVQINTIYFLRGE